MRRVQAVLIEGGQVTYKEEVIVHSVSCVCLQRSRYYSNMYCTSLFGVQRFSPADSNGDGMICPEELESEGVALYFLNCYFLSFPFQVMFPCNFFLTFPSFIIRSEASD